MIPIEWIEQAQARLAPRILQTPVTYDEELRVFLKWENRQKTGSFKIRGATNKVLTLEAWERERGLVTASAGNHGQGVALAAREWNVPVHVFCPRETPTVKLEAIRSLGAILHLVEGGYSRAEVQAQAFAKENESAWISPYNDAQVIAGQGTLVLELAQQIDLNQVASLVAPIGGGGLLAGIASACQQAYPHLKVIGVQSQASPYMAALFQGKTQSSVVEQPSLAEGLAGAVEDYSVTIPLVRTLVEDVMLVSENEIAASMAWVWHRYGERIEGSAAVGLAAVLFKHWTATPAVVILTGGNVDEPAFEAILAAAHTDSQPGAEL